MKTNSPPTDQFRSAIAYLRRNFIFTGVFSCFVNILMLTGPLFMLQVYDRVLSSGSVDTLVALAVLALMLYGFMGLIDIIRSRVLVSVAHGFDARLSETAFGSDLSGALRRGPPSKATQATADLAQLRSFMSGPGLPALFDLPWMPLYLGLIFMLHTWLGLVGVAGAVVLIAIAVTSDFVVRRVSQDQRELSSECDRISQGSRRNVEAIEAMGMRANMANMWRRSHDRLLAVNAKTANLTGISASVTKVFRLMLQSAMLAVGAYLVINNAASGGVMIAASIIMSRGLQPIESAVSHWRSLLAAQRSYRNLKSVLSAPQVAAKMELPRPSQRLDVENVTVVPPRSRKPNLNAVNFSLEAGTALAVIGATGSGKSTLGRVLTRVWPAAKGKVRLDGVPIDQYIDEDLGNAIGYLPQDVELFGGTIAENIARFAEDASDEEVIKAAKAAGVHELITSLDGGYAANVGDHGAALSGGQRQRIGLARALYGDPFLIVLDEPNSNLDAAGEQALNDAVQRAKQRGAIVVLIAHRPSVLAVADKVAHFSGGQLTHFGDRDEVIGEIMQAEKDGVAKRAQPVPSAAQAAAPQPRPRAPSRATLVPNLIEGLSA